MGPAKGAKGKGSSAGGSAPSTPRTSGAMYFQLIDALAAALARYDQPTVTRQEAHIGSSKGRRHDVKHA